MDFYLSPALSSSASSTPPIHVPLEVLTLICEFAATSPIRIVSRDIIAFLEDTPFDPRIVKRLRRVNKAFNHAATPYLIRQVHLLPTFTSISRLSTVSHHPVFSKYVEKILLEPLPFVEEILDVPEEYAQALNNHHMFAHFPKENLREGYKLYCSLAVKQKECREQGLHLQSLSDAFAKMPNLREVLLSPSIRSVGFTELSSLMKKHTIPDNTPKSLWDHLMMPATLRYGLDNAESEAREQLHKTVFNQYLCRLTSPAVAGQIQGLVLIFSAQSSIEAASTTFGGFEKLESSMKTLFQGLKQLSLEFEDVYLRLSHARSVADRQLYNVKGWTKLFRSCLLESTQLTTLTICHPTLFTDVALNSLALLGGCTLPRLRKVTLALRGIEGHALRDFIIRHSPTLKDITLSCELRGEKWQDFLTKIKPFLNPTIDSFALEHCSEASRRGGRNLNRAFDRHYFSVSSDMVKQYLFDDGFNPTVLVTIDDLQLESFEEGDEMGGEDADG